MIIMKMRLCVQQLASHGLFDVHVKATGDIHIDDHHTNEDVALAIGTVINLLTILLITYLITVSFPFLLLLVCFTFFCLIVHQILKTKRFLFHDMTELTSGTWG